MTSNRIERGVEKRRSESQPPPPRRGLSPKQITYLRDNQPPRSASQTREGKSLSQQYDQPPKGHSGAALSGREIVPMPSEMLLRYALSNYLIEQGYEAHPKEQEDHLKNSKQAMERAAEIALKQVPAGQPKRVLINGGGNLYDTCAEVFASKFDEIVIVEINAKSTKQALDKRIKQKELRKKFKVLGLDVTGVIGEYHTEMMNALERSKLPEEFIRESSDISNKIARKALSGPPNVGENFDLVVSQLLLSQLPTEAVNAIEEAAMKKFGSSDAFSKHQKSSSHQNFMAALQQAHIRYLRSSASAILCFADTYQMKTRLSPDKPYESVNIVSPENFEPELDRLFKPKGNPSTWVFNQTPESLSFLVKSQIYEVKTPEPEQSGGEEGLHQLTDLVSAIDLSTIDKDGRDIIMNVLGLARSDIQGLMQSNKQLEGDKEQLQDQVRGLTAGTHGLRNEESPASGE